MGNLPPPVTVSDFYLAAIHDRLGEIRDRLTAPAPQPAEGEPVELREPAPPPAAPAQPVTEPARRAPSARKPSARKAPAGPPRTRTRKGA